MASSRVKVARLASDGPRLRLSSKRIGRDQKLARDGSAQIGVRPAPLNCRTAAPCVAASISPATTSPEAETAW